MSKTKTARKATHKGTCQVCGCVQKLPAGLLSLHGYTKQWGFFQGTCTGAEHKPFEQDISLIEGAIARAEAQAATIREKQEKLCQPVPSGTTKAWINVYFCAQRVGCGVIPSHYRTVELECYAKPSHDGSRDYFYHAESKSLGGFDSGEHNRMLNRSAKTLEEAITLANADYAKSMDKTLAEIAKYVQWQRERIRDWAPKPLLPL